MGRCGLHVFFLLVILFGVTIWRCRGMVARGGGWDRRIEDCKRGLGA